MKCLFSNLVALGFLPNTANKQTNKQSCSPNINYKKNAPGLGMLLCSQSACPGFSLQSCIKLGERRLTYNPVTWRLEDQKFKVILRLAFAAY